MNPESEFKNLLRQHKFKLVSDRNHYKYADPDGRILVVSKTPSDFRAYHNMVRDLKHTVANPPPSNHVLEFARRRKILEEYVRLHPAVKKTGGISGVAGRGKGANSRGTGFIYDDPTAATFVPDEVKEQQRNDERMDGLLRRVKKQRKQIERELEGLYWAANTAVLLSCARWQLAKMIRGARAEARREHRDGVVEKIRRTHWEDGRQHGINKLLKELRAYGEVKSPGESVFDYVQALDEFQEGDSVWHAEIVYHTEDERLKDFIRKSVNQSVILAASLWQVRDHSRPAWVTPGKISPMNDHDIRRATRMMLREMTPKHAAAEETVKAMRRLLAVPVPKEKEAELAAD